MKTHTKMSIPSIRAIQAFEQTAQQGNIVKAAEVLNISPSAVSHQIASLESLLGKKLFYRKGRGIELTSIGEKYLDGISGALHVINTETTNIIKQSEKESLNIHASPSIGLQFLLPRIEKFKKQYNELQINLTCSYQNSQFNLQQIDLDIRHGAFSWKNLDVIPIKNEHVMVLASPDLLKRTPISNPHDLVSQNLILSQSTLVQWRQWLAYFDVDIPSDMTYTFCFDRSYMSFEAAKLGLGFILESNILAEQYIKQGVLVPVFDTSFNLPVNAHYMVYPYTHKKFARVQHFVQWFKDEIADYTNLLN